MNLSEKLPPLFHSIGIRLETLIERLSNLPIEKFPTPAGEKLVSLFIKGAKRLKIRLEEHAKDWLNETRDRNSLKGVVRRIFDSTAILYSYLECIEAFYFEKTRSEVILPFELLMKKHFPESKNDIFIFYPQWDFNFTYLDLKNELRKILFIITSKDEDEFFKDIPGQIVIISFPALERDNILALVALAHELAHYLDKDPNSPSQRISDSQDVLNRISIPNEKVEKWIKASKKFDPAPESIPPLLADLIYRSRIIGKLECSIPYWLRELTADISAARFFGIAFYLSTKELFSLIKSPADSPYPPNSKRIAEISKEIIGLDGGFEKDVIKRIGNNLLDHEKMLVELIQKDMTDEAILGETPSSEKISLDIIPSSMTLDQRKELFERATIEIIEESIESAIKLIRDKLRRKIPPRRCLRLTNHILVAARCLKSYIPPAEKLGSQPIKKPPVYDIRIIFNAVWLGALETIGELSVTKDKQSEYKKTLERYYKELTILSRISLRAIELSNFRREYKPKDRNLVKESYRENKELLSKGLQEDKAGVLGKKEIINLMMNKEINKALVIMPLLDPCQITEDSIDLTLGNVFIVMRQARLPYVDFHKTNDINVYEFQERIQLRPGGEIVLHPNQFMLGSTLEYIALPNSIMAYVIGKSSLGRVGLVIATATHVAPGFKGTITLELSNLGSVPIVLHPTMQIAQLVFHRLCTPVKKGYCATGVHAYSTGPAFSKYLVGTQLF